MRCIYLTRFSPEEAGWAIESCTGHDRPYTPSIIELRMLCTSGETSACPIFGRRATPVEAVRLVTEITLAH